MLLGLKWIELRYPQSKIWRVVDFHNHRYTITVEWNKPVPGIPYLPPLLWKEPRELVAEVFRFAAYPAWRKGSTISTRNRTCYVWFTLPVSSEFERMLDWVYRVPRIFHTHGVHGDEVVQQFNTIDDEKLPSKADDAYHLPDESSIAVIGPSSPDTTVGHVLPSM